MYIGAGGLSSGDRGRPEQLVENARTAERLGFDLLTIPDTFVKRELYTCLGLVADRTESIDIAPMVTNPVTRHPMVTASGICTVNEISDGRARLGIASGDSPLRIIGKRPARLAEMEESLRVIQSLIGGRRVEYEGTTIELPWVKRDDHEVPLIWAAEGPKTQRLAGTLSEGVLLGGGILPDLIDAQAGNVIEGARSADRDPDEVETWVMARCNIGDDRETAIDELKPSLAGVAHHSLSFGMAEKGVPERYVEPIETLIERYDSSEHGEPGSVNKEILEELELTDYLVDRYAVVGTPEDCVARMNELAGTPAIDGVFLSPPSKGKGDVIRRMGEEVLPHIE